MGNAGLEESGEAPDLTERKILRALKPSDIVDAVNACMDAMNEGMASEIPTKNPDELERVYQIGRKEAEKRLPEVRQWLGGTV